MYPADGGGGSTLLVPGFERHDVSASTLREQAQAVAAPAGDVDNFNADLTATHNTARSGVAGVLAEAMDGADAPTKAQARNLIQGITVASGAVRAFAGNVETFDESIADLNRRIARQPTREEQQETKAGFTGLHASHVETLQSAALTTRNRLEDPLDPEHIRSLHTAGALPSYAPGIFSNITDLDVVPWEELPFDLAAMTPAELTRYMRNNPEVGAKVLELRLREEGLLTGPRPDGYYWEWLKNAAEREVDADTIIDIARTHDIRPEDFDVLNDLEEVIDRDGKSFFLLPTDISGDDAKKAVIMTYIFNAGTDYGSASTENDFEETPYSAQEIQRIMDRQDANNWTYRDDVGFVHGNDGRLATTPNGMMMGIGGNWLQDRFSLNGGTAWGDTFMVNIDGPRGEDAAEALRNMIEDGVAHYEWDDGDIGPGASRLDLDRLLHHEERHSQQWAEKGYGRFIREYLWEQVTGGNHTEEDAGLRDGGY